MDANFGRNGARGILIPSLPSTSLLYNSGWMSHEADDRTSDEINVIAPSRGCVQIRLRDLWSYRDLLLHLAWRDVKVRSKQTALGVAFDISRFTMKIVVFTISFGGLALMRGAMGDEDRSSCCATVPTAPFSPLRAAER